MNELTKMEKTIMEMFLHGEHPLLENLRHQLSQCRIVKREFTGVGFFTDFEVDARLAYGKVNLELSDVHTEFDDVKSGIGFVLFIRDGLLSMLEGYTYGTESYPENASQLALYYAWNPGDVPQIRKERNWNGLFDRLHRYL